jgi:EmrB/QacA subfamily drug resistance transporter
MPASPAPCDPGVVRCAPEPPVLAAGRARWVLVTTILGSGLAFVDSAGVGVALPIIQRDLHATVEGIQWVEAGYALFLASLMLVGGSLGDVLGRRRIFNIGIVLFTLASMGCALSPSLATLIAARAAQGIGGACLIPGSLALLSTAFSGEARARAIALWSGYTAIMTAAGPLVAGSLLEHVSWRWIFVINVPLALAALLVSLRHAPESHREGKLRLDLSGAALVTAGLAALVFGLIALSRPDAGAWPRWALFAGAVLLVLFVVVQAKKKRPMIPLGLFRRTTFSGANLFTLFLYLGLSATMFVLPFNLISVQGYSPMAAGAAMLPLILIVFGLSRWSGGLITRYGPTPPLIVGPIVAAVGLGLLAVPDIGGSYLLTYFPGVVVLGLGMATSVAPLTTVVMDSVDEAQSGLASGVNNSVSELSGLLAVAIVGILLLAVFEPELRERLRHLATPPEVDQAIEAQMARLADIQVPEGVAPSVAYQLRGAIGRSFVNGFRFCVLFSAGLALLAALVAALTIRRRSPAA